MEELRRIVTEAEERDEAGRVLGTETVLVLAACDFTTTDFGRRKVGPNTTFCAEFILVSCEVWPPVVRIWRQPATVSLVTLATRL
eukprot:COSAG04_NODE_2386_length_4228_cov_5.335917_2_plen_85_part_00